MSLCVCLEGGRGGGDNFVRTVHPTFRLLHVLLACCFWPGQDKNSAQRPDYLPFLGPSCSSAMYIQGLQEMLTLVTALTAVSHLVKVKTKPMYPLDLPPAAVNDIVLCADCPGGDFNATHHLVGLVVRRPP